MLDSTGYSTHTLYIGLFELTDPYEKHPNVSEYIPYYVLRNPSLVEVQKFWYDPRREDGVAAISLMKDLGAQYFKDFRDCRQANALFQGLFMRVEPCADAIRFNYDDPRGGIWVVGPQNAKEQSDFQDALNALPPGRGYEVFEAFGGRYHDDHESCPEIMAIIEESARPFGPES